MMYPLDIYSFVPNVTNIIHTPNRMIKDTLEVVEVDPPISLRMTVTHVTY